jgi:hypothetical protein
VEFGLLSKIPNTCGSLCVILPVYSTELSSWETFDVPV